MAIKPIGERVLVKLQEAETKTASGLYIPDTAQEKAQAGIIEAVGEVTTVKVGDKVMYDKYAGTNIKYEGTDYLIIKAEDIIAVVD